LAWLLTLSIATTVIPMQALAYYAQASDSLTIETADGKMITPDQSWEETFPYGTFAFGAASLSVTEAGEGKISIYRLGGTKGRATAYLTYAPVIYETEAGVASYANALSADDVHIRVEEAMPIAKYQPVGKDPDPLRPEEAVGVVADEADENGDVRLTLDFSDSVPDGMVGAWQWYAKGDGDWEVVQQGTDEALIAAQTDLDSFDFRCVYKLDGTAYCSDSLHGQAYVYPEQEVLEEVPDDITLNPDPTYAQLDMSEEDPYSGYAFAVTFADGEWVKDIYVQVVDDEKAEADEFAAFMIRDCEGGSLYDTANTLSFHAVDSNAPEPSEIGFAVTDVQADKADGTAELTVRRTGGKQQVLSIDYATADGTAKAGEDYASASGTLAFYSDVDEMTIEVPLINDGIATEDTLDFTVTLSGLKGDSDGLCALGSVTANVSLYNTAAATGKNLVTVLSGTDAVDVSGTVVESNSAAAPTADVITGEEAETEQANNEILLTSDFSSDSGDVSVLTYDYPDTLVFPMGSWIDVYNTATLSKTMTGKDKGPFVVFDDKYLNYKYSAYYGKFYFLPGVHIDYGKPTCTCPYVDFRSASGQIVYTVSSDASLEGGSSVFGGGNVYYTKYKNASYHFSMDESVTSIKFGQYFLNGDDLQSDSAIVSTNASDTDQYGIEKSEFRRRAFDGAFHMRVYTANDSDSAPGGAPVLTEDSGVYDSMQPTLSFVSEKGGSISGYPYVGSTIRVSIPNSASYFPAASDATLNYAVLLTDSAGNIVKTGTAVSGNPNAYNLELVWSGMTDHSISDDYTIQIVMTRKQNIAVDLAPSVPRATDENGNVTANIDTSKIDDTANAFLSNAKIEYGYSQTISNGYKFTQKTKAKTAASNVLTQENASSTMLLSSARLENLQWICFNLPPEDKLVYDGVTYDGDAKIYLTMKDLAQSKITFRYYAQEYAAADSVMTTDISQVALCLDANGNGRIDGYYNRETGYFVLTDADGGDTGAMDEMVMFLEEGVDYDESMFAPAVYLDNLGTRHYAQYFLKAYYTMTPRNLMIPESGEDQYAQILPSFITDVTSSAALGKMTAEQKAYRYIVSGLSRSYANNSAVRSEGDYARSADNHIMYSAQASQVSCIDIPLGGDFNQLKISGDTITWNPDYRGNLLYRFEYPEQPVIRHSLAGSNIPVAKIQKDDSTRGWSYVEGVDGVKEVNDYLGSYTYNDTFALSAQEQTMTTEQIKNANGVFFGSDGNIQVLDDDLASAPAPESTNRYHGGLYENSDYLKVMQKTESPDLSVDSKTKSATGDPSVQSLSGGAMPEAFNMDVGTELPSFEVGATDYVTVTVSGYEIGFSIGVPLAGYNSNGDAGTGGTGNQQNPPSGASNWYGAQKANQSNLEDMGKLKDFLTRKGSAKDMDDSWAASHPDPGQDAKFTSKGFQVGFAVAAGFLFKYDPVSNAYCFSQFTFAVSAQLQFTIQYRLQFFPPLYVFVTLGGGVEMSTGMSVDRIVHETKDTVTVQYQDSAASHTYNYGTDLDQDETIQFTTGIKAFNIVFSGTLYLDYGDNTRSGMIESDGSEPVLIVLSKQENAKLASAQTVTLTALEDSTSVTRIALVDYSESSVYWDGLSFSPSVFVEAGFGLGIMFFKVEGFVKFNIDLTVQMGVYERTYDSSGLYTGHKYASGGVEDFELSVGLAVRAVLGLISYEMDLVRFAVTYTPDDGWNTGWGVLGDRFGTLSLEDADGNTYESPIRIGLLGSTANTQNIYSPSNGNISLFAYQPSNTADVPFELSGYGSSGDAFKLADGLITGYDYKVVSVGQKNYMVYTISRSDPASELDNTQLVLSELNVTWNGGEEVYGLINPLDTDSATKYIVLDKTSGGDAETGGDLEFSVWTEGNVIHAAWVSYEGASSVGGTAAGTKPTSSCPTDMTKYNYITVFAAKSKPATVTEPTQPTAAPAADEPTETLTEPVESAYYVAAATYDAAPGSFEGYAADGESPTAYYYNPEKGSNCAQAQAAYQTGLDAYHTNVDAWTAYQAYQTYLTEKVDYDNNLLPAYQAYLMALAAYQPYEDWYHYFRANDTATTDAQSRAFNAAKNTVVRTSSFDTAQTTGFTTPTIVSGATGSHVFLPDGSEGALFYAKAVHYTGTELQSAIDVHSAYLNTVYSGSGDGAAAVKDYNMQTTVAQWQFFGKQNELHAVMDDTDYSAVLDAGAIVENIDITRLDADTCYVAYTTGQTEHDSSMSGEAYQVRRMYVRAFFKADGSWSWGAAHLLRTLVDYDVTTGKDGLYVGASLSSSYEDPYFANLRFLNGKIGNKLHNGEIISTLDEGALSSEAFLLFEMDGACYVIRQADLGTILSSGTGTLYPFFRPSAAGTTNKQQTSTGRTAVTIGTDGEGNIAAVYVGSVPNSLNNAVYLTRFDPSTGEWGAGTMLAMRGMQIYEDGLAGNRGDQDAEKAYLGKLTGYSNPYGTMQQFQFSNLQIAMGLKDDTVSIGSLSLLSDENKAVISVEPPTVDESDLKKYGYGGVSLLSDQEQGDLAYALDINQKNTLLILTQGAMLDLVEEQYNGETVLMPDPAKDAAVGIYALSYGIGGQGIGQDTLTFPYYNFSTGSALSPTVSFLNTGDVSIRGSAANPITVKLMVRDTSGSMSTLDTWTITKNIRAGQRVELSGTAAALTSDLEVGSVFYFTVEEDTAYITSIGGTPFNATTLISNGDGTFGGTLVVASKPELDFESFEIKSKGVDESGNTLLSVDFQAGNRGSAAAKNAYVQFTYETGTDAAGNPVYAPLDLTEAGTALTVSKEEPLVLLGASTDPEKKNGILYLYNSEDGGDISTGKGRTVSGTVVASPDCYKGEETGSLNVRVEVFSDADTLTEVSAAGVKTVKHGEYNTLNNKETVQIEHATYFTAADKLTLAMGNTLRLPVSVATTTGTDPVISASEAPSSVGDTSHLGILYYTATGSGTGMLIMTPSSTGEGVIHLYDTATNTTKAITYTVNAYGEGINIFRDNNLFTFQNKNGSQYNETQPAANQTWSFKGDIPTWGQNGTAGMPYLSNLAYAEEDSSFTFRTVASSMDLHFNGTATVESTFPGFDPVSVSATGGSSCAAIDFGDNVTNYTHTVMVTVTSVSAQFDRLVEHYASGTAPTPADDANAPQLYWSRSFPDTASIEKTGSVYPDVTLTCYVLDDTGLSSVLLGGQSPTLVKNDDGFWQFDVSVNANQALVVEATDQSGNRTSRRVTVDWFSETASLGATATAPAIQTQWLVDGQNMDTVIGAQGYVTGEKQAALQVTGTPASGSDPVTVSACFHNAADTAQGTSGWDLVELTGTDGMYDVSLNGYYQAAVTADDGTWSARLLLMNRIDGTVPVVDLSESTATLSGGGGTQRQLVWSARKDSNSAAPIASVTMNGYAMTIKANQNTLGGTHTIEFSGDYTVQATDGAGNQGSSSVTVSSVPIALRSGAANITPSWNQAGDNGEFSLDDTKVTGGKYDIALSDLTNDAYYGSYEYALVPAASAFSFTADPSLTQAEQKQAKLTAFTAWLTEQSQGAASLVAWTDDADPVSGLARGDYMLYVRDAQDKDNAAVIAAELVTVGDEKITISTAPQRATSGQDNGAIYVTAAGGKGPAGVYQFAILPMQNAKTALTEVSSLIGWQTASLPLGALEEAKFSGLAVGSYQIGVRAMVGVTAGEMSNLSSLYSAKTAAQNRHSAAELALESSALSGAANKAVSEAEDALTQWMSAEPGAENQYKALIGSDADILAALTDWQTAADDEKTAKRTAYNNAVSTYFTTAVAAEAQTKKAAAENAMTAATDTYENELTRLNTITNAVYAGDATLWTNAATVSAAIELFTYPGGGEYSGQAAQSNDLSYDKVNKTVTLAFPKGITEISEALSEQLVSQNGENSVIIRADGLHIRIPAGTLSEGDDVAGMIVSNPGNYEDRSGCVVVYTDGGGAEHVVMWSSLNENGISYIASEPGQYSVVDAGHLFSDVTEDYWGRDAVRFAAARGLFQGLGDGRFDPNGRMTRGMFVTVLGRLAGIDPTQYAGNTFDDVDSEDWYGPYVQWAAENGIVLGNGSGFDAVDEITREQICVITARFLEYRNMTLPVLEDAAVFEDQLQISGWAADDVTAAQSGGLIQGRGNDSFDPSGRALRSEVATILQRLIQSQLG